MDLEDEDISVNGWKKVKNLGSGGFGVVTLWENESESKQIAVKVCRDDPKQLMSSKQLDRWVKEVENLQKLSHPNLVKVLPVPEGLSELSSHQILCMEYCSQGDLRKVLHKPENCCGLPEDEVRSVIHDIKGAIQYLHSHRIIHRDLKPENIVLQSTDDSKIVYKLIDLGFAKDIDKNSLCSSFVGTLQYLAPELFTQDYTSSVDYWSFGLVCHEIITGVRPFLPNMHPVDWMKIVKSKSSDEICIFEDGNGEIIFSKEIFPENHISQPFKYDMEKWLCLALEWDGSKRGKSFNNKPILFSNLDVILKKKIISVFSTSSYSKFGYEIDESTLVKTLKQWVQRDTKQPANTQIVLLPSGESLNDNDLVYAHWNPELVAMLYVFPEEGLLLPTVTLKPPPLVSKMLESPKTKHKYQYVKRAWANGVYFLQQLLTSYQLFLESYAVKMLSLLLNQKAIASLEQEAGNEFLQVFAKYNFCKFSTQHDLKFLSFHSNTSDNVSLSNKWTDTVKDMDSKFQNLTDLSKRLNTTICATRNKITKLQHFAEPGELFMEELSKLISLGFNVYTKFRHKNNKERMQQYDSVDMYKIILLSIKVCSRMFKDEPFLSHLADVNECEQIIKRLLPSIKSFKMHITKFNQEISDFQYKRQKDVWDLVYNLKGATQGRSGSIRSDKKIGCPLPAGANVTPDLDLNNSNSFILQKSNYGSPLKNGQSGSESVDDKSSGDEISSMLQEMGIESDGFLVKWP